MTNVSQLPISEIIINPDVNIRELDTDYVSELMEAQVDYGKAHWQAQWKDLPKINQDGILFSGFHTVTAAQRNFGDAHEVSFQVVEGNPYLLAACENASHGKRRTNADKRTAVLRWLQDDEGKQWTDSHIAKQCHVSDSLVNSVDLSLQENGSDTYDRPTKRKYIDKHGNASWMETAKINDATGESEAVIAGEKSAGDVLKARDASTAKKRKKQVLKNMWDKRKQAAKDYVGDSDTDLNQYLSQDDLEKGFANQYESYAEAFASGMKRINAVAGGGFKAFEDRAFEVDEFGNAKVDISDLEAELKAISAYAYDILIWQRPDWSPDTNWILPLIAAKKKASDTEKETDAEPEDTVDSLWERITPAISAWKAARKGTGVGHASKTMFISAIKRFDSELSKDSETDVVLLKKLLNVVTELHGPVRTFERYIKMQCDGASIWEDSESDETLPFVVDEEVSERDELKTLREQVKAEMPKWKQRYKESGKEESELVSRASFSALIHVFRNWEKASDISPEEREATAEELKELLKFLKDDSYVFIYRLRDYLREAPSTADESSPLENTMSEMESIQKFDARLKEFGAHEELVCDSLHFYYGIERADLSETPQETLVEISEFIEGFIDKPLEAWPEYIRNQVPKRELVLVSIGVSRDNDEFELVEFTDESSDEVWCKLDELPQELKDTLFELAVKKIVESEEA